MSTARFLRDLVGRADGNDFAAADAGAGAEVDQVVGGPHRVFIVFDDDDRVAQVAEFGKRIEQTLVIARMEADRWFVENVEHADEAATDLAGEADALRFAAGKRWRGAFERKVFEADVEQEAEAAADFFEHLVGDLFFVSFEHQLGEELDGIGNRPVRTLRAAFACRFSAKRGLAVWMVTAQACGFSRLPAQSGQRMTLMYCSSWRICVVLLLVLYFSSSSGIRPSKMPPYFWAALPARQVYVMCSSPVPQSQISRCFCVSSRPRLFEQCAFVEAELALHCFGDAAIDVSLPATEIFPRADELDAALLERLRLVGHKSIGIEAEELAEAVAGEAHAVAGC